MISKESIEAVRKKADLVKIISEYVPLKKRGKNYLGLCPFHSEKTPSFVVSPDKEIFHCFGCHAGGNLFGFVMKAENVSFTEAVELLAQKLEVPLVRTGSAAAENEKERLYALMAAAVKFYQELLLSDAGEIAREYLTQRKVHPKTAALFSLGYGGTGWDELFKFLVGRGYKPEEMEGAGLVLPRQGGQGYYDRFRERLLFPIFDLRGRAIAFSGRTLKEEQTEGPKYLNSPDTPIFNKGMGLYGLNLSQEAIKKNRTAVLVEGNLDLISCFQAGITPVAAPLGTALTLPQAKLLARFAQKAIFAFDADAAGVASMERCLPALKEAGLEVSVAVLEGGKDPDEVIRNQGPEKLMAAFKAALSWVRFKIERILSRYNLAQIEGRGKASREVAVLLAGEENQVVRGEYLKEAAKRLGVEVEDLAAEVRRASSQNQKQSHRQAESLQKVVEKPASKLFEAEKNLLFLALANRQILQTLREVIVPQELNHALFREIFSVLFSLEAGEDANLSQLLLAHFEQEEAQKVISEVLLEDLAADENLVLKDCLKVLKEEKIKTKLKDFKHQLFSAEKENQAEEVKKLGLAISQCTKELQALSQL